MAPIEGGPPQLGGDPAHPPWHLMTLLAVLAAAGGLARYAAAYQTSGRFDWKVAAAGALVSAFSGFMLAEAFILAGVHTVEALIVAAGVGGWAGPFALEWLTRRLLLPLPPAPPQASQPAQDDDSKA